jgi:hypothetical protein
MNADERQALRDKYEAAMKEWDAKAEAWDAEKRAEYEAARGVIERTRSGMNLKQILSKDGIAFERSGTHSREMKAKRKKTEGFSMTSTIKVITNR